MWYPETGDVVTRSRDSLHEGNIWHRCAAAAAYQVNFTSDDAPGARIIVIMYATGTGVAIDGYIDGDGAPLPYGSTKYEAELAIILSPALPPTSWPVSHVQHHVVQVQDPWQGWYASAEDADARAQELALLMATGDRDWASYLQTFRWDGQLESAA